MSAALRHVIDVWLPPVLVLVGMLWGAWWLTKILLLGAIAPD